MKEKWVRINTIEGYEDIRDQYWISNADEDKVMNRSTGKQMKIGFDVYGYKRVKLYTKDGKYKMCKIYIMKASAFLFGPIPLGANVVRHLNDVKIDNRLTNLAWGTRSDNMQDCIRNGHYNYEAAVRGAKIGGKKTGAKNLAIIGKKTGAKNGKRSSKPVRCLETGIIYPNAYEAERQLGIDRANISHCCNGRYKTAGGYHWEFVNQIAE